MNEPCILIVDDLPDTVFTLKETLQQAGFTSDLVRTPNRALRQLESRQENPYRLAMLDLYLPIDGSRLRDLPSFDQVFTGFNQGQILGQWMVSEYPETRIVYYTSDRSFFNGPLPQNLYNKIDTGAIDAIVKIAKETCPPGEQPA